MAFRITWKLISHLKQDTARLHLQDHLFNNKLYLYKEIVKDLQI